VHQVRAINLFKGLRPAWFFGARCDWRPEGTRGRLGLDEPLGSVERVNLQQRIDRWVSQGLAWLMHKLIALALGNTGPASAARPGESNSAIPLHRDPWCGTYVSPEISFPLEQAGQVLHFCSSECRARYERSSQRAASA
jgi:YHS domain-containing protein